MQWTLRKLAHRIWSPNWSCLTLKHGTWRIMRNSDRSSLLQTAESKSIKSSASIHFPNTSAHIDRFKESRNDMIQLKWDKEVVLQFCCHFATKKMSIFIYETKVFCGKKHIFRVYRSRWQDVWFICSFHFISFHISSFQFSLLILHTMFCTTLFVI